MKRGISFFLLLLAPAVLVALLDEVPRFVYASCTYYSSCDPAAFTVTAEPAYIAIDESSVLEAQNGACPCSWSITSQPGGWQLSTNSDCTATLLPYGSYGQPGSIVISVSSGTACQKSITVVAGSAMRIEVSTDAGATWLKDSTLIRGYPGSQVDVAVRTVMTIGTGETLGWSYSVKHDASNLVPQGGDLQVTAVTASGTHTATVQGGGLPDYDVTAIRSVGSSSVGFVQGVVIDYDGVLDRDPVLDFVMAGACYRITFPVATGSYQAAFSFTGDLPGNDPPIVTKVSQVDGSLVPFLRDFVMTVYSSNYYPTPTNCNIQGSWTLTGEGAAGPPPVGGGGGQGGGGGIVFADAPVSMGDVDDDGSISITDPINLLTHLFLGGEVPKSVDTTAPRRLLRTQQTACYEDLNGFQITCVGGSSSAPFAGQDADYQAGTARTYTLVDPDEDDTFDAVIDDQTGLMWQRRPDVLNVNPAGGLTFTLAEAEVAVEAMNDASFEGFSDWRLPTIGELISILDYSRHSVWVNPAPREDPYSLFPENFLWGDSGWAPNEPDTTRYIWTSTDYPLGLNHQWVVGHNSGRIAAISDQNAVEGVFSAVRGRRIPAGVAVGEILERNHGPNDPFKLGDADASDTLNITDAVLILNFLFQGGPPPAGHTTPVPPESFGVGRFSDGGFSTVEDSHTELLWLTEPIDYKDANGFPNPAGAVEWKDALEKAENFIGPGEDEEWRLPNANELSSLTNYLTTSTRAMDPLFTVFSTDECNAVGGNGSGCEKPFWSSTTAGNDSNGGGLPWEAFVYWPNNVLDPTDPLANPIGGMSSEFKTGALVPEEYLPSYVFPVHGP